MKFKKFLTAMLLAVFMGTMVLPAAAQAAAKTDRVITLGADLSAGDREKVAQNLGVDLQSTTVPVIEVTNKEERKYLQGLVPAKVIGSRAISSAMVEVLPAGSGISVNTRNITWVTNDMYANALTTAQVKDARITAVAPFPVSGTAALTGIFKAFEAATGQKLNEKSKKVANEELVRMGELGEQVGKEKATQLIMKVKEQVVADKITDPAQIKQIIINVAGDLNINLDAGQIDQLVALMQKIGALNLNIRDVSSQLQDIKMKLDQVIAENQEVKGILQRILAFLNQIIEQVRAYFTGEK